MTEKCDKTYRIEWYGPFVSEQELNIWEQNWLTEHNTDDAKFNLYLLRGKKKFKKTFSYYCGKTKMTIYRRIKGKEHHSKEISSRDYSIWIGKFANIIPDELDINVAEKIVTSALAVLGIGDENLLNKINKKPPKYDVYILNQWFNNKSYKEYKRIAKNYPAKYIPDLIVYNYDKVTKEGIWRGCNRLKKLKPVPSVK